jgi:hypothetical protein
MFGNDVGLTSVQLQSPMMARCAATTRINLMSLVRIKPVVLRSFWRLLHHSCAAKRCAN